MTARRDLAPERPIDNVVVIMADQLQAALLPCYGNADVATPAIDALAARGEAFDNAFAAYPVCVPSRVSLWTGRWPHLTGSRHNQIYLGDDEVSLPQVLKAHGWRNGLIGKNHCFTPEQTARDFDVNVPIGHGGPADVAPGSAQEAARTWIREFDAENGGRGIASAAAPYPAEAHPAFEVARSAVQFIEESPREPFLMWVSFPDPHTPYQVPEPYASRHDPDSVPLPPCEPDGYQGKPERFRTFAERMLDGSRPGDLARAKGIYLGMIELLDDAIARILESLDRHGLTNSTLIVVTSDHGDYMGEHGLVRKGAALYDCLIRVPLIVANPAAPRRGTRSTELVSLLDVFPSVLQLLDLPCPPGRSGIPLPGFGPRTSREVIFAETGYAEGAFSPDDPPGAEERGRARYWQALANHPLQMARTHEWKYVYPRGGVGDELYDLRADPHELVNLAQSGEHREVVHGLRQRLLDWNMESQDILPQVRFPGDDSRTDPRPRTTPSA